MELEKGRCNFCPENSRILSVSDSAKFTKHLPHILYNVVNDVESIQSSIKMCPACCHKIQFALEVKDKIQDGHKVEDLQEICYFCGSDETLVKVEDDWKYFNACIEGCINIEEYPVQACTKCIYFYSIIYNFKTKLLQKFSHLLKPKHSNHTPRKRKASSVSSPTSSKRRKTSSGGFKDLEPLIKNNYNLAKQHKQDDKLYKKIPFVNLHNSQNVEIKATPKIKPIIKIKLKVKGRREYVSKSVECPTKNDDQHKSRRHSYTANREVEENNINETPKSAIASTFVPKRRVSIYLNNEEKNDGNEEEIQKVEEPTSESPTPEVQEETNEKEVPEDEKAEENVETLEEPQVNGDKKEEVEETSSTSGSSPKIDLDEAIAMCDSDKCDKDDSKTSTEEQDVQGDSDSSDNLNNTVSENGSERKKKKVTFSDQIDD